MSRRWPEAVLAHLKQSVIDADDHLDAMWRRVDTRLGRGKPRHLAAYDWSRYSEHRIIIGGEDHALLFLTTSTVNGRILVSC